MSASNCPFEFNRKQEDSARKRREEYVKFDHYIDPEKKDLGSTQIEIKKLISSNPEEIFEFLTNFDELVKTLEIPEGSPRFRMMRMLLTGELKKTWQNLATEYLHDDQDSFDECRIDFILQYVSREIALDTKEWLRNMKKPYHMTVHDYLSRYRRFNNYINIMPPPMANGELEPRLTENNILVNLRRCGPTEWQSAQLRANLQGLQISDQAQYLEALRRDDEKNNNKKNNNRNNNNNNRGGRNNNNNNRQNVNNNYNRQGRGNGGYRNQNNRQNNNNNYSNSNYNNNNFNRNQNRNQYNNSQQGGRQQQVRFSNNQNNGRGRGGRQSNLRQPIYSNNNNSSNNTHRYHTRSQPNPEQISNIQEDNNNDNNDDDPQDSEDLYDIYDEEFYAINETTEDINKQPPLEEPTINPTMQLNEPVQDLCTEVQASVKKNNFHININTLLDTGARGNFIKKEALKSIPHILKPTSTRIKGRYKSVQATELAIFNITLPEFCKSKSIRVIAYVEEDSNGRHDLVLGRMIMQQLGMIFNFKTNTVIWDELSISMKPPTRHPNSENINVIDREDANLTDEMRTATKRMTKGMSENQYEQHDYKDMINKCHHLKQEEKQQLLILFEPYRSLFDGTLGKVPGPPVKIKLKKDIQPFCSLAYTVPQAFYKLARGEVKKLEDINLVTHNINTAWVSPWLF